MEQVDQDLSERIRERAHEIWVASGYRDGEADRHWLAAEHEIEVVTTEPQRGIRWCSIQRGSAIVPLGFRSKETPP